jgi:hypothetical protein
MFGEFESTFPGKSKSIEEAGLFVLKQWNIFTRVNEKT